MANPDQNQVREDKLFRIGFCPIESLFPRLLAFDITLSLAHSAEARNSLTFYNFLPCPLARQTFAADNVTCVQEPLINPLH
jgi:hypothetical protein